MKGFNATVFAYGPTVIYLNISNNLYYNFK